MSVLYPMARHTFVPSFSRKQNESDMDDLIILIISIITLALLHWPEKTETKTSKPPRTNNPNNQKTRLPGTHYIFFKVNRPVVFF